MEIVDVAVVIVVEVEALVEAVAFVFSVIEEMIVPPLFVYLWTGSDVCTNLLRVEVVVDQTWKISLF